MLCDYEGMAKDYTPPKNAADVYARYKAHYEGERGLKPKMLESADADLQAGATVGQLAAWTGLTPEVFRRRARALGVERKRPPTVGRLTARLTLDDARSLAEGRGWSLFLFEDGSGFSAQHDQHSMTVTFADDGSFRHASVREGHNGLAQELREEEVLNRLYQHGAPLRPVGSEENTP